MPEPHRRLPPQLTAKPATLPGGEAAGDRRCCGRRDVHRVRGRRRHERRVDVEDHVPAVDRALARWPWARRCTGQSPRRRGRVARGAGSRRTRRGGWPVRVERNEGPRQQARLHVEIGSPSRPCRTVRVLVGHRRLVLRQPGGNGDLDRAKAERAELERRPVQAGSSCSVTVTSWAATLPSFSNSSGVGPVPVGCTIRCRRSRRADRRVGVVRNHRRIALLTKFPRSRDGLEVVPVATHRRARGPRGWRCDLQRESRSGEPPQQLSGFHQIGDLIERDQPGFQLQQWGFVVKSCFGFVDQARQRGLGVRLSALLKLFREICRWIAAISDLNDAKSIDDFA